MCPVRDHPGDDVGAGQRNPWRGGRRAGIVGGVTDTPEPYDLDNDYSIDDEDQLQPSDTLDDRGVDDVLDEGYSPPDYEPSGARRGLTTEERRERETLDERLAEEEPDVGASDPLDDPELAGPQHQTRWRSHESDADPEYVTDHEVGDRRSGRLVAPDAGYGSTESESVASDVGIDGAGASAEEAAVHYIDDED